MNRKTKLGYYKNCLVATQLEKKNKPTRKKKLKQIVLKKVIKDS